MELVVNKLEIGKFRLNFKIPEKHIVGVISKSVGVKNDFLLVMAGMIDNFNCVLIQDNSIFDNQEYLKNRIYLDFKKKYLSTLNIKSIRKVFKENFGIEINEKEFKKQTSLTNIRSEISVTTDYSFTEKGINLCCYLLLKSIKTNQIIINNPLHYFKNTEFKKEIVKHITNKTIYDRAFIDIENVLEYTDLIDKYIIFGDYQDVYLINPLTDTFIMTDDHLLIQNKIYKKGNLIIALYNNQKSILKQIKQKYKILSFAEIIKYLGNNHE